MAAPTLRPDNAGAAGPAVRLGMPTDLATVAEFVTRENGLAVVSTLRRDGTIASSVVNAGTVIHPITGDTVVAMVARGDAHKVAHLRARPHANVVWRSGWRWVGASGVTELIGPDDPCPGVNAERLRTLLREVFVGAGGTHDDWPTFDAVMADERRLAVLVKPVHYVGVVG